MIAEGWTGKLYVKPNKYCLYNNTDIDNNV